MNQKQMLGKRPITEYQSKDELLYDIKYYCDEIEKCIEKFLGTKITNETENKTKDEIIYNIKLIKIALKKLMRCKWILELKNNEQLRKRNNDQIGKKPIRSKVELLYDIECYCENINEDMSNDDYYIGYEIEKIKNALKVFGVF